MCIINRSELTRVLKYIRPRNIRYYQNAFIHRSINKKLKIIHNDDSLDSNERLEFLGDSIINIVIADYLFEYFPNEQEGFLTKTRIKLVKGQTLAKFAEKLELHKYLKISNNTMINTNILENVFEALVGSIYLDYKVIDLELYYVRTFLYGILRDEIDMYELVETDVNYKDKIMRLMQKNHLSLPRYKVVEVIGEPHKPIYKMSLTIKPYTDSETELTSICEAHTKKDAEQECAKNILEQLST